MTVYYACRTGANVIALRGSTKKWIKAEADSHSQILDGGRGHLGRVGRRNNCPDVDRNPTGRLTGSITWIPKLCHHQRTFRAGMSPTPNPALHICSRQAAHSSWLCFLASVGLDVPNLAKILSYRVRGTPGEGSPTLSVEKGRGANW